MGNNQKAEKKFFKTYKNISDDPENDVWEAQNNVVKNPNLEIVKCEKTTINIDEINKFFQERNALIDENRRVHLSVLCDSTHFFLLQMVNYLEALGCTDIQTCGYAENDGLYGYKFEASGILPEYINIK